MSRTVLALLAVLLAAGCGLPLPSGVQAPGQVPDEQRRAGQITVLPPGPQQGASARDTVIHFLGAQSSPEGGHALARQFLTPRAALGWRDDDRVRVYDPSTPPLIEQAPQGSTGRVSVETVTVISPAVATVERDGTYHRADAREKVVDTYRVSCEAGRCRVDGLDPGLRLTPADLSRSFVPRPVYFLAPALGGAQTGGHLVPDLVWLPRADLAGRLVQAVLDGPSAALQGSAATAAPAGTGLVRPVTTSADGTVTVDLTDQARGLDDRGREQLSAQLIWSLRALRTAFSRLRLLVQGQPLTVGGGDTPQDARAWPTYDPERLRPRVPLLYLDARRVRSLPGDDLPGSATAGGPVDLAAASPLGRLALLTRRPDGTSVLRTGPLEGPLAPVPATGALSSPTWGSGEQGLFLLRNGRVVLLSGQGGPVDVPVVGTVRPLRQVQVARDGVHVALLAGDRAAAHLFVGRLVQGATGPRVVGLMEVVPGLRAVVDVAWESSTSLVVLATRVPLGRLPARVAVDGSASPLLDSRLPAGLTPVSLTASADGPVVLAGTTGDGTEHVYRDNGTLFTEQARGRAPFYPG